MDPVTHMVTGALISRVGFNRRSKYSTAVWVLAAEAPDLDILYYFLSSDPVSGFAHHRGWTHTFLGAPVSAAATVGLVYLYDRWRKRGQTAALPDSNSDALSDPAKSPSQTPRWGLLLLFGLLAAFSHILLDYVTNYGVRPFEPFNWRWYSGDLVFIIEPEWIAIAFFALVLPSLFGLVSEEIGSRSHVPRKPRGRGFAIAGLMLIVGLWGVRAFYHERAVTMLKSVAYENRDPLRVSAYPYMWNPFKWYCVAEMDTFYRTFNVDTLDGVLDPESRAETWYKHPDTPAMTAAKQSRLGQVYLDWAQYPYLQAEPLPNGETLVRFRDLRYMYPGRSPNTLGAWALVDSSQTVVEYGMKPREKEAR